MEAFNKVKPKKVKISDYEMQRTLGSGSFGRVKLAKNKKEGKHPLFPNNTAKKNFIHDDIGKDEKDANIKVNKSQTIKASNNNNE